MLATGNRHKLGEFRSILAPCPVVPMPPGVELPPEGVESFADNAASKAVALAELIVGDPAQVALKLKELIGLNELPLFDSLCAVSVGVVDGQVLLDLDYEEDSAAEVDMNVVLTGEGKLVEVQATAEGEPYTRATLDQMMDMAAAGGTALSAVQAAAVEALG